MAFLINGCNHSRPDHSIDPANELIAMTIRGEVQLTFPFDQARSITILAYKNRREWQDVYSFEQSKVYDPEDIIAVDSFLIEKAQIKNAIQLKEAEITELYRVLYHWKCEGLGQISFCYDPRHFFIFKDADGIPFAGLEICLDCSGGISTDGFDMPIFCETRIEKIKTFLKEKGVTYFQER